MQEGAPTQYGAAALRSETPQCNVRDLTQTGRLYSLSRAGEGKKGRQDKARGGHSSHSPFGSPGSLPRRHLEPGSHPRGYPIPYHISKECGWFPWASTPQDSLPCPSSFLLGDPEGLPNTGLKPNDLPTRSWPPGSTAPTAHLV